MGVGISVIDEASPAEVKLHEEFEQLRTRVVNGLLDGTLQPWHGRVDVWWGTRWAIRHWRFRQVHTVRRTSGIWISFGVHFPAIDSDDYDICFISSEGGLGSLIGYTSKGCYINQFNDVSGEFRLELWVRGLKAILGESGSLKDDLVSVNPT